MTKDEAKARTIKGIWNCIELNIKRKIENACDYGVNEVRVDKVDISTADVERLKKLGYSITSDDSDRWCPEYIIKWE
jgi:hypothetical protein